MSILKSLSLEGGDPFRRLAFDKSPATNVSALLLDLKIADDYKKYLTNTTAINTLIALDPDSPIAAGWAVTLLRAKELGLTSIQNLQFKGGISADFLLGSSLKDSISGDSGDDKLFGGAGEDNIHGGLGNDTISGGSGNDRLFGGDGPDFLEGGPGDDITDGGPGSDTAALSGTQDEYLILKHEGRLIVAGPDGVDEMTGVETLQFRSPTGSRTQQVDDLPGNAWAYLASYPDLILAFGPDGPRALEHFKNHGFEEGRKITFDAQIYLAGYRDLQAAFGSDGVAAAWHYVAHGYREGRVFGLLGTAGNNDLVGSATKDRIFGYAGNDRLFGGDGPDFLEGGPGDDIIDGGPGSDALTGGEGQDTFVFNFLHAGEDTIRDFDSESGDKIAFQLEQTSTAEHVLGLALQDGTDTIIPIDSDTYIRLNNVLRVSLIAEDFFIL